MNKESAVILFESLASGIRLDIYRMLVKAGLDGMVAGELSQALDLAPNKLSFHLKAMTHAGLTSVQAEGRYQRYRANISVMSDVITYLTEECCSGHPELCSTPVNSDGCNPSSQSCE